MKPFSEDLLAKLENATVAPPETRPRVLLGAEEVAEVRRRASATPGFVDRLVEEARAASGNEDLFGAAPELPYFCQTPLRSLANAAFILEDEAFAARALAGVEVMFSFPPEEWVARPHRPMRCDHAMLNVASAIGSTMDLCSELWPADAVASISEANQRVYGRPVSRDLEKSGCALVKSGLPLELEDHVLRRDGYSCNRVCGGNFGFRRGVAGGARRVPGHSGFRFRRKGTGRKGPDTGWALWGTA